MKKNKQTKKVVKTKPSKTTKPSKPNKILVQSEGTKSSRAFVFTGLDGKKYSLTLRQKHFAESYLVLGGNGAQAIIDSGYDVNFKDKHGVDTGNPNYKLAAVMASENLIKPNISAFLTFSLEKYGFTENNVEKQHLFLLNQYSDLRTKAKAIDMFYKRQGSYAPEKKALTDTDGKDLLKGVPDDLIAELARRVTTKD